MAVYRIVIVSILPRGRNRLDGHDSLAFVNAILSEPFASRKRTAHRRRPCARGGRDNDMAQSSNHGGSETGHAKTIKSTLENVNAKVRLNSGRLLNSQRVTVQRSARVGSANKIRLRVAGSRSPAAIHAGRNRSILKAYLRRVLKHTVTVSLYEEWVCMYACLVSCPGANPNMDELTHMTDIPRVPHR